MMPEITEEQIADVIDEHLPNFHGGLAAARALLDLFAPILAEKEREIEAEPSGPETTKAPASPEGPAGHVRLAR